MYVAPAQQGADAGSRMGRVREVVAALARLDRRTATPGERASAELVAHELRAAGARDVRLLPFRTQRTWAAANVAHAALGVVASRIPGPAGRVLALATAASLELDYSGRRQWLRRLIPAGEGTTVVGRIPAAGRARRTLVLVAHHDAAHTGLVWHPWLTAPAVRNSRRTGTTPSFIALPLAGLAATALGARRVGRTIMTLFAAFSVEAATRATVPGANDNATGVAAVLELARALAVRRPDGIDVVCLFPGGEEVGVAGMAAWMRAEGRRLDRETTLFLGLDAIGSGETVVSLRDGLTGHYGDAAAELADAGADRAGVPRPRRIAMGTVTDPLVARQHGFAAVSILSQRRGAIANLHLPTDTPQNVDWDCVERTIRLAAGIVEQWGAA